MLRGISSGGGITVRPRVRRSSLCASRRQLAVQALAAPQHGGRSIPEAWSLKTSSGGPAQQRQPDLSNPARWQLTSASSEGGQLLPAAHAAAEQVMACVASLKAAMLGDGSCGSCLPPQQAAMPGSHSPASRSGHSGAPEALHASGVRQTQHQRGSRACLDDRQTLLDPLQQAGFISSSKCPTVAGVMAAASVVLVGLVWRSMQQTAQLAELQRLQRQHSQENAQALATLRNRYRHALGDAESTAASTPGSTDAAGSPDDFSAELTQLGDVDQEAARQYQRFMTGAKAANVPMWSSEMLEGGPQMSETELEHQTQMIRSAATDEERAAMEDSELRRQLVDETINSQLAELSGAPIGRAAREAWRKEQAALKQQRAEQQLQEAAAGAACSADAPAAGAAEAGGDASGDDNGVNPFAISSQEKARFRADDHLFSDAKPRPLQGSSWGGLGAVLGLVGMRDKQQQQQQQAADQERPRRRGLLAAAGQAGQQQQSAVAGLDSSAEESSAEGDAQMRAQLLASGAARRARRAEQQQQQPLAAAEATGDEAAAAGQPLQQGGAADDGLPESEAQMRAQLLASGAARRARRAQQQQEVSAAAAAAAVGNLDGEAAAPAGGAGGAAAARQRWQQGVAIGDSSGNRNRLQEAVISDLGITAPLADGAVLRMKAAAEATAELEAAARAAGRDNARLPPAAVPAADAKNVV